MIKKLEKKVFTGSKGWLWFWIIFFWPVAVFYYADNRVYLSEAKFVEI